MIIITFAAMFQNISFITASMSRFIKIVGKYDLFDAFNGISFKSLCEHERYFPTLYFPLRTRRTVTWVNVKS